MEVRSEAFTVSMQKDPVHHEQPSLQSMRLDYASDSTAIYKPSSHPSPFQTSTGPSSGGNGALGGGSDSSKKRRGRPRKYAPDGSPSLGLVRSGSGPFQESGSGPDGLHSPSSGGAGQPVSSTSANPDGKKRGRPPGSTNKKHKMAPLSGAGGIGFTPHVITVKAGEDVSSKIMSFSQNGPRAICVLSANGAISNVTLRQAATSGRTVTYEGRFEILSLSGSYMLSEGGAHKSRAGGLSVSLAGPDGRVLGGGVAGLLIAASPVQVIIGSFIAEGNKEKKEKKEKKRQVAGLPTNEIAPGGGVLGPASPPSRGTVSESSGSPFNQSNNININSGQPSFSGMHWE